MQTPLRLALICLIASGIGFAQGRVTDQQPVNSGSQPNGNSVNTSPSGNRSVPSSPQGAASGTPSAPNQSLPGDANPANASTGEGKANGSAVRSSQSDKAGSPTGTGSNPADGDNGANPASDRDTQTAANSQNGGRGQWFWVALGLVLFLFVIRVLMGRSRVHGNIDRKDPALRVTSHRDRTNQDMDAERERDRIRRAS
jgi:hypothetical protein